MEQSPCIIGKLLGKLAPGTGWVLAILDVLDAVAASCSGLKELLSSVLQAVKGVADRTMSSSGVAELLIKAMKTGLKQIIDFIARAANVKGLAKHIGDKLNEIKQQATKPLRKLLCKVYDFIKRIVGQFLRSIKLQDDLVVYPRASKDGKVKVAVEKDGTIKVSRSDAKAFEEATTACKVNGVIPKEVKQAEQNVKSAFSDFQEKYKVDLAKKAGSGKTAASSTPSTTQGGKKKSVSGNCPTGESTGKAYNKLECETDGLSEAISEHCQPCNDGSCFVAGTLVWTHRGTVPIECLRVGDRVLTFTLDERGHLMIEEITINRATWRLIRLLLRRENGSTVVIELLRTLDWIEDYGAHEGGQIWLDMKEMSAVGLADVLAIEPCPEIDAGPGGIVTATFQHTAGEVLDLKVASESKPFGVTPPHPIKSEDRNCFVAAGDLRKGETLKTLTGTVRVESITKRPEPEPVYNIEVEGDHVYRVGESGVLVHNASAPCCNDPFSDGLLPPTTVTFAGKTRSRAAGVSNAVIPPCTVSARAGQSGMHAFNRTGPPWWSDFTTANPVTFPDAWQRGHLLGSQLGGNGHSNWDNMVPLHSDANKGVKVKCENRIVDYILTCGDCVTLSVSPDYTGNNMHPNYLLLEAESKNKKANGQPVFRIRVRIYNQVNAPPRVQCQPKGTPPSCS